MEHERKEKALPSAARWFYVGSIPAVGKNHLVRSMLHGPDDFIVAFGDLGIARKVALFMNQDTITFRPNDAPIVLAMKVASALKERKLVLP